MNDHHTNPHHPFARLASSAHTRAALAARAETEFESGRVSYLVRTFFKGKAAADEERNIRAANPSGRPELTFAAFRTLHPTFPIVLAADKLANVKLHLDKSAMLPALLSNFSLAPFVAAYEALYETCLVTDTPLGMVFPRKGVRHGMVIYATDDPNLLPLGKRELFLLYVGGERKHRHYLVLRSFEKLLAAIHADGHGWRPHG